LNFTCGEVREVSSSRISSSFQFFVSRDINLKAFELSEIRGYLRFYPCLYSLYSRQNTEWVEVPDNNSSSILRDYNWKVVQINSYNNSNKISQTKDVFGVDLQVVSVSGTVTVTCQKPKKEVRKDSSCKSEKTLIGVDGMLQRHVVNHKYSNLEKENEILVFREDVAFHSMDKAQRSITLKEPIVLEKSRSPYTFKVNLENKGNNEVNLKTMTSSEYVLISKHGTLAVKNLFGNFAGIQSFCFEHISNRD
jgi:hypothetical protein